MRYKLGKLPARKNSISFRLKDYLSIPSLPIPPVSVNHQDTISNWQMLGNDQYGDCVWAGAGHETMLWTKNGGKLAPINEKDVLAAYTAVTGFNPNDPSTDQGTDMQLAASYRQKTGIVDNSGKYHRVVAYLSLTPGNYEELKHSIYLFENAGIGWQLPESAQDQTQEGKAWSIVSNSPIEGGHYTPAMGYDAKYIYIITWGQVQKVEWAFFDKYCDEALVYFSDDMLNNGKSLEGFNVTQLQEDLKAL